MRLLYKVNNKELGVVMVKRDGSYEYVVNKNMRGGVGEVKIEHLLTPDELYNKGRLFARITINSGSSIGYHIHEGEMESFYIVSGTAKISDNEIDLEVGEGDTVLTKNGMGHSVESIGNNALVMIALIVFD